MTALPLLIAGATPARNSRGLFLLHPLLLLLLLHCPLMHGLLVFVAGRRVEVGGGGCWMALVLQKQHQLVPLLLLLPVVAAGMLRP